MTKICVCGHFGEGKNLLNGQTIKTKIVTGELERIYGINNVSRVDSHGGAKKIPQIMRKLWNAFGECDHLIMLPGDKGLRVFTPLFYIYNLIRKKKTYYVVIGGWIDGYVKKHRLIAKMLKTYTGIYVETASMQEALKKRGFKNVSVMYNFKDIKTLKPEEINRPAGPSYKLCTFSRLLKEKGIEEAVNAVERANEDLGRTVFTLDLYGMIERGYEEEFEKVKASFSDAVSYKGRIDYDKSTEVLKDYFALLFPTYYEGEGFAGTLIDGMSAGLPVIASDWHFNKEIVKDGVTGILLKPFPDPNPENISKNLTEQLTGVLKTLAMDPDILNNMRESSLREANKYSPDKAIRILTDKIGNSDMTT